MTPKFLSLQDNQTINPTTYSIAPSRYLTKISNWMVLILIFASIPTLIIVSPISLNGNSIQFLRPQTKPKTINNLNFSFILICHIQFNFKYWLYLQNTHITWLLSPSPLLTHWWYSPSIGPIHSHLMLELLQFSNCPPCFRSWLPKCYFQKSIPEFYSWSVVRSHLLLKNLQSHLSFHSVLRMTNNTLQIDVSLQPITPQASCSIRFFLINLFILHWIFTCSSRCVFSSLAVSSTLKSASAGTYKGQFPTLFRTLI